MIPKTSLDLFIIRAAVLRRRRGYCDHFVTMCVCVRRCVSMYVSTIEQKPLIAMT